MVEFGLKLLDNRVSEWSAYYIDYEKLKALLKKSIEAEKKRKELEKKDPDRAAKVVAESEAEHLAATSISQSTSVDSLKAFGEDGEADDQASITTFASSKDRSGGWTYGGETTTLLPRKWESERLDSQIQKVCPYGTQSERPIPVAYKRMESSGLGEAGPSSTTLQTSDSSTSLAQRTFSYFTRSRYYTERLQMALVQCDKKKKRFDERLDKEVSSNKSNNYASGTF